MSKDANCPYCNADIEICHDDGLGYAVDERHEMECPECEKNFTFYTHISFSYRTQKADCLNGPPHDFEHSKTWPKERTRMRCKTCDVHREMTHEERTSFMEQKK